VRDERTFLLDEGFEDGSLWFERASEIEDVPFDRRDLADHFFFVVGITEDLILDLREALSDVFESREARVEEVFDQVVEEVRRGMREVVAAFALALIELVEKMFHWINGETMPGDEVVGGDDDVELTRVGCTLLRVEEGCVDGEVEAVVVVDRLGLVGGRDEFLDGEWMDIEVFLEVADVFG